MEAQEVTQHHQKTEETNGTLRAKRKDRQHPGHWNDRSPDGLRKTGSAHSQSSSKPWVHPDGVTTSCHSVRLTVPRLSLSNFQKVFFQWGIPLEDWPASKMVFFWDFVESRTLSSQFEKNKSFSLLGTVMDLDSWAISSTMLDATVHHDQREQRSSMYF